MNQTTPPRSPRRLLDLWGLGDDSFNVLADTLRPPIPTSEVESGSMLGDRLVPEATFEATFESESAAPAARLWAWVAQAMRGGGMYGWRRLDNPRHRPADRLLDGIPPPRLGDQLDGMLEVCRLDPHVEIVWRNMVPLTFLDTRLDEITLDYRVHPVRRGGARLTARLCCIIDGGSRPITTYAAGTLAFILPSCQVNRLTQHADLDVHAKPRQCDGDARFQHLPLTPGRARRRQES